MSRRLVKIATIGTIGVVGLSLVITKEMVPSFLLPVHHLVNVLKAGVHMSLIYKYSSKPMTDKHKQASYHLK